MGRRLKIAVADDERDTREYFQEYLSHLGHEVRAAADGRQLLELCQGFGPDLVVTDYGMPGLDGLAAAAEINRLRPVPVIVVSGQKEARQRVEAAGVPAVTFLAKPVKAPELKAAVEAAAQALAG